jgi:hypothetical protein
MFMRTMLRVSRHLSPLEPTRGDESTERFESRAISGSSTTESTESAEAYENGRVRIRIWNLHHSSKGC